MRPIELERTVVKSPPELWDELGTAGSLARWLGEVKLEATQAPHRLEWSSEVASGVIELEAAGWGTKVRAVAQASDGARETGSSGDLERRLGGLLDELGASSLTSG